MCQRTAPSPSATAAIAAAALQNTTRAKADRARATSANIRTSSSPAGKFRCPLDRAASYAQIGPIWIGEFFGDQLVELFCEQPQAGVAARVLLIEPFEQDHVGDGGEVAQISALRLCG